MGLFRQRENVIVVSVISGTRMEGFCTFSQYSFLILLIIIII